MEKNQAPAAGKTKRKRRRGNRQGHPIFTVLKVVLLLGCMGVVAAGGVVAGYVASLVKDEPVLSREEIQQKIFNVYQTGFAYYNDGTLIGQLRAGGEDRRVVKKSEVSPYLINAIIATEDKYFYEHHGIVFQSTLRAAYQEFTHQPVVTGGSTLTQQLIKNTILSQEVSHKRKATEIFYALRIEQMFSKDQILEAYINEIYFGKGANGSNIYGVQAAAKGIFNKDVKDLTLAEASYLAGIPQNPIGYSPFSSEGYANGKKRQKTVLDRMLENGYITQAQYDQALNTDLKANLAKPEAQAYSKHPFLMMEIEERAAKALVDTKLAQEGRDKSSVGSNEYRQMTEDKRREMLRNGYHVYTTIDKDVNDIMEQIASDPKNFGKNISYTVRRSNGKTEKIENALEEVGSMLIQNKTGRILGMMGGRDFQVEQTNHATAPRQPGSAMKPLAAYAPAFELGYLQPGSPIDDSPLLLSDGTKGSHLPMNWDNKFRGVISAREALRQSWNVPAIKTYLQVGIPTALEYVKKMGVTTLADSDNYAATGAIGGLAYGLTAEEITNAYATFANGGTFIDAYMIERIEDSQGRVVYQHTPQPVPVFSPQTAYLITDMMRTVVNSGTGASVRNFVPRSVDVAGKTGTTNSSYDLWFVGYTPELSMGVWTGYDDPYMLPSSASRRPMEIWGKVMKQVLEKKPDLASPTDKFERPSGIVSLTVDSKSGLLPSELSKESGDLITDLFNRQFVPTKVDDSHQKVKVVQFDNKRYLAKEGTPDDFVSEGVFFKSPDKAAANLDEVLAKNPKAARPADWERRLPEKEDPRTGDGSVPSAPSGLTVAAGDKQLTLNWKSAGEADLLGYRIYRADASGVFTKLATVKDPKVTTYQDASGGGGPFGYYVTSVDVEGNESAPSAVASASAGTWEIPVSPPGEVPPQPGQEVPDIPDITDLPPGEPEPSNPAGPARAPETPKQIAISKANGGFQLSWKANPASDHVVAYNIYYATDPAAGFQLLDTVSSTTYLHKSANAGVYRITAINSYGESPQSGNVSAR
ncbi:PBP1A family penicillin-binding protein [Brevibacillus massiliensis]|uniref:PBP1A family penicillin-binding protein n=1 Tax=Brevibacillus massiliensis TaxID=1118054 RepID=UPI00031066DE|nr:PBP1A family penicillin-binding protein [Brevibacillus massiliensis]